MFTEQHNGLYFKARGWEGGNCFTFLVDIFKYPQLYVFSQTIKNRNIFVAREDKNNRVI